jgi:hypothetical protein
MKDLAVNFIYLFVVEFEAAICEGFCLEFYLFVCLFYVVEFGGVIYEGVCCEFHFLVQKLGLNFFGFRFD